MLLRIAVIQFAQLGYNFVGIIFLVLCAFVSKSDFQVVILSFNLNEVSYVSLLVCHVKYHTVMFISSLCLCGDSLQCLLKVVNNFDKGCLHKKM